MVVTPVVLLSLLGGVGFAAKWGYEGATAKAPEKGLAQCVPTDVGDSLEPDEVYLRVLNAGETSGLAKLTATYLRAKDFRVLRYNNANTDEELTQPVVIGNSSDDPEVKLVMGFFENAVARGDGRSDHIVDVLLPTKLARVENPKMSVKVDGLVCLPPPSTAGDSTELAPPETPDPTPSPAKSPAKKK
jgi:hypothetical protein